MLSEVNKKPFMLLMYHVYPNKPKDESMYFFENYMA